MAAPLAFLICSIGIAGLFYLDRDKSARTSKALWLPVIWLWIAGSRPVTSWFGIGVQAPNALAAALDGSPIDAAIFEALIVAGSIAVFLRRSKSIALVKASMPVLVYFLYCMISVTWSPVPDAAFKRWIKEVGDLVMVLIIATDARPVAALRRLYSRVGFVLFPLSIVLIRYSPLGRGYDPEGIPMNTGVTTNKNTLGLIVFLISLGALWRVLSLLDRTNDPNRRRHLVAQGTLLALGLVLLEMAHSATSIACFILGSGFILATRLRTIRSRPARVHALCFAIFVTAGLTLCIGGTGAVAHALGRSSSLSGRTEVWALLIPAATNPIVGSGFESFWNGPGEVTLQHQLKLIGWWHPEAVNEAHNGYLEVYLELGWVGVGLISFVLMSGYRRAVVAFRLNPSLGGLMLAYIIAAAFYSITEAGFRIMNPMWIFLLLGAVVSNGIASGIVAKSPKAGAVTRHPARELASGKLAAAQAHLRSL